MPRRRPAPGVAVVTGASSGIGRATARRLCADGARVVLVAREPDALEDVAHELGPSVESAPADVADAEALDAIAQRTVRRHGGIDLWVNDAGVAQFGAFAETPPDMFRRTLETNLMGVVNGTRAALRELRRQPEGGVIVNVSSILGRVPSPYLAAYATSKYAVRGFSASVREELRGTEVELSTVLPGVVDTPIFHHAANLTGREITTPPPRVDPDRVAATIVACAQRPRREVMVGGAARAGVLLTSLLPRAAEEWILGQVVRRGFIADRPDAPSTGNLDAPSEEPRDERGGWPHVMPGTGAAR
jgi:short-subunit dehydrogenase